MTINAIIFDCDGTLVDSELLHAQVEIDLVQERLGITYSTTEHNRRFSGVGLKRVYEVLEEEMGRPIPADFDAELNRRKNEAFQTRLQPIPHIAETLKILQKFRLCVASNTPLSTVKISLKATNLYDFFAPHIFSAQMVARSKPAPDLFLYAARQLETNPENVLVIEDSYSGVQAAIAAGMRVFGFAGGSHCSSGYTEKLQDATLIFDDMRQLPDLIARHSTNARCERAAQKGYEHT